MTKEDLILNNPLRALGLGGKADEKNQGMGLVMARAGLGKTAILVQIALDFMMRGEKVLHVSIGETVEKARSWYDDIFSLTTAEMNDQERVDIEPEVMRNRMIMTFKESAFSIATLQERLDDLVKQDVYTPRCLIVDGYDFKDGGRGVMQEFATLMEKKGLGMVWFSAVSHRGDSRVSQSGVPAPCHEIDDMFSTVLYINPLEEGIRLDIIKCAACEIDANAKLAFDPSTMLIKKA
ncbi:MAG: hypothetical protein V2I36_11535 [Desulfopila sp.]|jgi:hypothetical protein|nr:hypothetical protein [Desulfopila sp.]